jgi:hypothetical protein
VTEPEAKIPPASVIDSLRPDTLDASAKAPSWITSAVESARIVVLPADGVRRRGIDMSWLTTVLSRGGRALVVAITMLPVLIFVILSAPAWCRCRVKTGPVPPIERGPPLTVRGVLAVEDWAEIRRLHRSGGLSARAVARRLGVSRGAVARALASVGPPKYERRPTGSAVDAFEPAIRVLLAEFRSMCRRR